MSISNTFVNKVDLIFTHTIDLNYYKKTTLTTGGNNPINIFLSLKTLIYVSKTMQIIANIINSHPTWEPKKKKIAGNYYFKFFIHRGYQYSVSIFQTTDTRMHVLP